MWKYLIPKLFFQFAEEGGAGEHAIETEDVSTGVEEHETSFFKKEEEGEGEGAEEGTPAKESPAEKEEEGDGTPAEKGEEEPSKEAEGKEGEVPSEPTIDGMTDAQFDTLMKKVLSNPDSPYNDNPAWQRIIKQRDAGKDDANKAFGKLVATDPKAAYDYLLDNGYEEADAKNTISGYGVSLETSRGLKPEKGKEDNEKTGAIDEVAFMQHLTGLGVKYDELDANQRDFWRFQYQFNQKQMQPFQEFVDKQKEDSKKAKEQATYTAIEAGHKELQKHLQDEFGLQMDSDIEGMTIEKRFQEYLQKNRSFVGTPIELFYVSHRDYIRGLGKREAAKTTAEDNEAKKRIKSEKPGSTGAPGSVPLGVGKEFGKTWSFLSNKHK